MRLQKSVNNFWDVHSSNSAIWFFTALIFLYGGPSYVIWYFRIISSQYPAATQIKLTELRRVVKILRDRDFNWRICEFWKISNDWDIFRRFASFSEVQLINWFAIEIKINNFFQLPLYFVPVIDQWFNNWLNWWAYLVGNFNGAFSIRAIGFRFPDGIKFLTYSGMIDPQFNRRNNYLVHSNGATGVRQFLK